MDTPGQPGQLQFNIRPKMLVVDDVALNVRLLNELFHDDFDIFMATDGLQAINRAQELSPDLILLDVEMPGVDGFEVCKRLKDDPRTQHIPVIFITAKYNEEDEVRGFSVGGSDFIRKPINPTITRVRVETHLALKQQADQLRDVALLDGLTGVPNRRRLDQELKSVWRQCVRSRLPVSLIMIDVDYFKRYNDCYGHQLGDSCLRLVAQTIKKSLRRPQDIVARYGGEEFVCVLPETDFDGARFVAEDIIRAVEGLQIEHKESDISNWVTISVGAVTKVPRMDSNAEELLEAVDKQLYKSKRAGRARLTAVELP